MMNEFISGQGIDYFRVGRVFSPESCGGRGIRAVADVLVEALTFQEFGIITRMEFTSISGRDAEEARSAMVIRCCFPRDRLAGYITHSQEPMVRCSGLIQEEGGGYLRIDLTRPVRLLQSSSSSVFHLAREVDGRLKQVLDRIEAAL